MVKKTIRKNRYIFLLIIVLLIIAAYFGIAYYIANTLTASKPNPTDDSPTFVAPHVTEVSFPTADGVVLHGWLFKNNQLNNNNRIIIHVAGFNQNRSDNDYYTLFIARDLYQRGYSVLLYDPRESGTPAMRQDFGQARGNDVLGAVQLAKENGFAHQNIGIIADSLGTVATVTVVEKLHDIGPIVIDSGIAKMKPLMELRMSEDHNIPTFLFPGIFFMVKNFYNIDAENINPIENIARVPDRTFLFLVGAKDDYIPIVNTEELFKAANPKSTLVVFPKAKHAHTYRSDPSLYLQTIYTFFDQQFAK